MLTFLFIPEHREEKVNIIKPRRSAAGNTLQETVAK